MSKMQKGLMWLFGAMFLVPEILWSPVVDFYYQLSQTSKSGGTHSLRNNFLQNSDNLSYLKLVIFIELVGLLLFIIFSIKNRKDINIINYLLIALSIVILLLVALALFFVMTFSINIL
jgi:hypothetical protein